MFKNIQLSKILKILLGLFSDSPIRQDPICRQMGAPKGRDGNPFQYACLENPMDGEAWLATVHGVAKEWDTTYGLNSKNLKLY